MVATPGAERYTPGHSASSVDFMAARRAETHAAFFLPRLTPGQALLDLGCGPGTITAGLAAVVAPGPVLGVDQGAAQLAGARELATRTGLANVRFEEASCYDLPLADASVDRVFSHALFEHLAEPARALAEIRRVLRPGGVVGLRSPDWGGFLLSPPLDATVTAYTGLQEANGGDPLAGRRLGPYLTESGFTEVRADARYERYPSPAGIADYLATQLAEAGEDTHAEALRTWAREPHAMFAQAWVSATAVRP